MLYTEIFVLHYYVRSLHIWSHLEAMWCSLCVCLAPYALILLRSNPMGTEIKLMDPLQTIVHEMM